MQLRAIAVAFVVVGTARGDTTFTSKVQVYADSDHTTVVSPLVQGTADVSPTTSVNLGYVADIVSSASVDIVTQASPTTIHDTRQQASGGFSHSFGSLSWHAEYLYSHENDYLSNNIATGIDKELFDKNTTLSLGYALSLDDVGRAHDDNFSKSLTSQSASASWTQIISPRLIAQLTYELGNASGFQSSPYRFVPVRTSLDAAPELWVMETDPDERWRQAIVVAANHAVGDASRSRATTASTTTTGASRATRSARVTSFTSRPSSNSGCASGSTRRAARRSIRTTIRAFRST